MRKVFLGIVGGYVALLPMSAQIVAKENVQQVVRVDGVGLSQATRLPRQESLQVEKAVRLFVADVEKVKQGGLHSIMVLQGGKVRAEEWVNGYTPDSLNALFSVTKTFTAMGVGLAIDEGRLKVTDKVVSFFPHQLPATVSGYLKDLEVKHLLTMTTGFDVNPGNRLTAEDNDLVRAFLKLPLKCKPGANFCYSSMNSYMLSAIVQKVTGETLCDYLHRKLFRPLGIDSVTWVQSKQGINEGGWGLSVRTEDLAKLGQLILQKGMWNGRQVVSRQWIDEMTTKKVASYPAGTSAEEAKRLEPSDWTQGYCYQMWRCLHEGVRADGANGQFIIILPEKDAVIAITSKLQDMGAELDLVWKHILPVL